MIGFHFGFILKCSIRYHFAQWNIIFVASICSLVHWTFILRIVFLLPPSYTILSVSQTKQSISTIIISLATSHHISFTKRQNICAVRRTKCESEMFHAHSKGKKSTRMYHTDVGRLNLLQFQFYPIHWFFYRYIDFGECTRKRMNEFVCSTLASNFISRHSQAIASIVYAFVLPIFALWQYRSVGSGIMEHWVHAYYSHTHGQIIQAKALTFIRWSKC